MGVRGAGGARGEEGVTAARAGARAPTFSSHTARHRAAPSHAGGTGARGRRGGPRPFRVLRASAPLGGSAPAGRAGAAPGAPRVRKPSEGRGVGRGSLTGAANGERAVAASVSRRPRSGSACQPKRLRVASVTPRRAAWAALGDSRGRAPRLRVLPLRGLPGVEPRPNSPDAWENLGGQRLVADEASGGGGVLDASPRDRDPGAPAVALQRDLSRRNFGLCSPRPPRGQVGERVAFVPATFTAETKSCRSPGDHFVITVPKVWRSETCPRSPKLVTAHSYWVSVAVAANSLFT